MTGARAPRSRFYDGAIYARLLDPSLTRLHEVVASYVEPGARMLDVGCGTGNLAFLAAETASEVTGIELSPAMVDYAERRRRREKVERVSFVIGDASSAMADRPDRSFDVATMVMTLHEMPAATRESVLQEVCRLADRLICVDFRVPMPSNLPGWRNRLAELAAGPEHFLAFRDFGRRGGVPGIAKAAGLRCVHRRLVDGGTLDINELSR